MRCGWRSAKAPPRGARWGGDAAFILAADTVVACGRRILPKAETDDEVRACLKLLSGRRHQVMTAVAVMRADGAGQTAHASLTRVAFKRLDGDEIDSLCRIAAKAWARRAAMPSRAAPKFSSAI